MRINYIKTVGFRKFKELFETDIYDVSIISGKNRSGKSNILYAIVNILLGTNLSGDEKACLINKNCDLSYGEIHFTDNNGMPHKLIRGRHRIDNKKNFITLDGKNITQEELTNFYKDKKLFLSIINPLYFLNKKPSEQKEMVDKYLSGIKPKESFMNIAYDKLDEQEKQMLETIPKDIPTYISELKENIKIYEAKIDIIDGKIDYAQHIIDMEIPAYKIFEKEVELSLARQELAFLNSNQDIENKEKQKKIVENLEKEILNKETEINELERRLKEGKRKYLAIKNGNISSCPTCGQHIENKSKLITVQNMKDSLTKDFERKNILETQKKDLECTRAIEKCKYHSFNGESTIEKSKRISTIQETIRQLESEQLEIEKFNQEVKTKLKLVEDAKNDICNFNKDKTTYMKYIDNTTQVKKIAQKLYISYIEEKMKLAKQYLKDVDIKFYSVLKTTGEIKEDFIITYKNHSLCDLSRSETIATALEFANMFNKIANTNFPIFIDDYESCADYDFIEQYANNTQLLISKVEKGTSLSITDYYNNADDIPNAA